MFKIGDRVKCIKQYDKYEAGKIYNIKIFKGRPALFLDNSTPTDYVDHGLNPNVRERFKLYKEVEIKEEKDYYKWLANR